MVGKTYGIREAKIQHLKTEYRKYTDHIISFQKHASTLYDDWVIDINNRNFILGELDTLIRSMIRYYNTTVTDIHNRYNNNADNSEDFNQSDNSDEPDTKKKSYAIFKKIEDGMDKLDKMTNPDTQSELFVDTKNKLLDLSKTNGSYNISDFATIAIGDDYRKYFDKDCMKMFDLYNKVFIPLSIYINSSHRKIKRNLFVVENYNSNCDGLIDNTCIISICLEATNTKITAEGYVKSDLLNAYVKTQIYSKYLFNVKNETREIINVEYPNVESGFLTTYLKFINSSCYFVNSPELLAERIANDYNFFHIATKKNFGLIMKEFSRSDVKTMFKYINLLLLGNKQHITSATTLFNLLKDKKVSGETLADIVFHNLSFYSQIKLKKASSFIKNEMARLKTLSYENISISKKLALLVNMPDHVKSYILEKNNEIKSGENNYKLQMAINGLLQFPWKPADSKSEFASIKKSMIKSRQYLQNVASNLDSSVYGHESSKKVLIELVGKWIQNPKSTGQVIGLVGPPGIGKTLLAKSISSALNIPLSIVGLGGMSDAADLIGHSFTYAGAQYGMIIRQMIKAGNWRSVMFFDEVDKVSKRNDTNEIYNTLIHITDPNMNQHFQDRFYSSSIEFDLSGVLIVFSYNDSTRLDPILLDRIKEIKIGSYSTQEKIAISQNYILKELCENIGFDRTKISFDNDIISYIIEKYTLEAGVREVRRKLEQILLKLNIDRFYMRGPFVGLMKNTHDQFNTPVKMISDSKSDSTPNKVNSIESYVKYTKSKYEDILNEDELNKIFNLEIDGVITIDKDLVHKYLEKPTMLVEEIHTHNLVGVVNGLYATTVGMGGIVPIQIYKNYIGDRAENESLKLKLTGNQKKVMKESVICAVTAAVNILNSDAKREVMNKFPYGFHIHAPDGGTPKDGPSAGCAFATAFISILLGKKINRHVAMTGEIELTGKISKIGGLNAKLAGAKKAGVQCVYICEENKEDYDTIKSKSPELFGDDFKIRIVRHIIDIVSDPNVIVDITKDDFDPVVLAEYNSQHNPSNK